MQSKKFSRRDFLRLSALSAAGAALAGCCPAPAPETIEKEVIVTVDNVVKEEVVVTEISEVSADAVEVRWFIGLGTGSKPEEIEPEEQFVEFFNAQQNEIILVPEIVDNEVASDTLKTEIASGDAPDLLGPVGVRGTNEFKGTFLDLTDHLAIYDMSDFSDGAIKGWTTPDDGLIGLSIGVHPSAIYINKDLFDEAGLDYPPTSYDEDWTVDDMTQLALQLTVDANGNDATSAAFDSENIVQFGYAHQWTDPRGWGSFFGAGNLVAADGVTAECPDHWRAAFKWVYDGMWVNYSQPNGPYINSDLLSGNAFGSGNVAMAHCHTWYTCCVPAESAWDYATCPSYEGTATAKLHTDMIGVMASTEVPEAAVKALYDIATSPQLVSLWGAVPALKSMQGGYIANMAAAHTSVDNWDTIMAGLDHVEVPNHESFMPNFAQADDRVKAFQSELEGTGDVDVDAAIDTLVSDLQAIYDAA
jgi:multiple sugar transport system substrate-binding protein